MCGIAGIIVNPSSANKYNRTILQENVRKMTDAIAHRGPDGEGHWVNEAATVAIGHRRLSIIDLSAAASQPMHRSLFSLQEGEDKRYTITYNGEIYNYIELRDTLYKKGYRFQSKSDTEVILAAYDFWKEDCLQHFDGMFALAIWDAKKRCLFAARDRFGEKPLFFFADKGHFAFASEMKALWAIGIPKVPDDKMLLNYIALGYVKNADDCEQTFFEGILSLPGSHYLYFDAATFDYEMHCYWKIDKELTLKISADDAVEKFNQLLSTSVSRRMRSDVAVGSSLSGGLDSSTISALIHQHSRNKPHSFSAVFPGFEKDEWPFIKLINNKFHQQHHIVTPTENGLIAAFEKLCHQQEEPFPSSSIYAQYKVYELAKHHNVKVLLDGLGADETMAGYHKYIHWYLQQLISRKKFADARNERRLFKQNNIKFRWGFGNYLATYLPAHAAIKLEQNAYDKINYHLDLSNEFISTVHGREWEGIHKPIITKLNDILYFNTITNGLEEQLRYADRNSMAHGVEIRSPFLSHELVEFIFSLPANFKIHEGWTKWILRKAVNKKLPKEIVWRKDKVGFESPQKKWMKSPMLTDYIHEAKIKLVSKGILKASALNKTIIPMSVHEVDNFDWRYLCAAQIVSPGS